MRQHLLSAAALAVCLSIAGRVEAQWAVFDASNFSNTLQTMQTTANQLTVLNQQLASARSTLQQVTSMQTMLTNPTNIMGMLPSLNAPGMQNSMPTTGAIPGQVAGASTSLTGQAQQFYNLNHVYTPTGTDAVAKQIMRNGYSLASIMGMAQANLQAIEQRQASLNDMQSELQNASDIKQVAAINGRIAIEANAIQGQQAQAANLQALANGQAQSTIQAAQEATRQSHEQAAALFSSTLP